MGGWKESGLGSRHGPDGIRKYTQAPVADGHPGRRAVARAHITSPTARERQPGGRRDVRRAGDQRPLRRRPARDARRALRHLHPLAATRPTATRPSAASGARAASHMAVPEGVEVALAQAGLPEEQVVGLRGAARRARRATGWSPATAAGGARADRRTGFCDQSPEALAGISTLRGHRRHALLRASRPGHRPQPQLGRDRLPGAASRRRRPTASARSRPPPDRARGDDRGRRLHRRLRGRRRGDRRRAGRRGQVGGRARGRRLPRRRRLRRPGAVGLPADVPQRRALPDGRGSGLDRRRHRRRRRHGDQLDQLPAHPRPRPRRVGVRARALRSRRSRASTSTSTRSSSACR